MTLYGYLCTGTADVCFHVVETTAAGGARDAGCLCLPKRIFMKYVKSRYDVIQMTPTELTIQKKGKSPQTLTPLGSLLVAQGCTDAETDGLLTMIVQVSADKAAQTNKGCCGKWVPV